MSVEPLNATREPLREPNKEGDEGSKYAEWDSYPKAPLWACPLTLLFKVLSCGLGGLEMAMLITFILSSYAYVFKVYSMVILTTNDAFVDPAFRNLFNSTYIDHTSTEDGATYWLHGTNWYILVVFAFPFVSLSSIMNRTAQHVAWDYMYWRLLERGTLLKYSDKSFIGRLFSREGILIWYVAFSTAIMVLWVQKVSCFSARSSDVEMVGGVSFGGNGTCTTAGFIRVDEGDKHLNLNLGIVISILQFSWAFISASMAMFTHTGPISLSEMLKVHDLDVESAASWLVEKPVIKQEDLARLMQATYLKLAPIDHVDGLEKALQVGKEQGILIDLNTVGTSTPTTQEEVDALWSARFESGMPFRIRLRYKIFSHLILLFAAKYFTTRKDAEFVTALLRIGILAFLVPAAGIALYVYYLCTSLFV